MDTNFAYLRDVNDNFFITLGDAHHDDTVACLPVYTPDPEGGRTYNGTRLSKTPKDGSADLAGPGYQPSEILFGALEVDRDRVEEVVEPYTDRDRVLDNLDEAACDTYEAIEAAVDADLMVIGSPTFGVQTDGSDLDLVWLDDYTTFEAQNDALIEEAGLEAVDEDWLDERIQSHAERYDVPEPVARYHHEHPQQRFFADGLKVGFSPAQVPGTYTDAPRPDPEKTYEQVRLEATVTDTAHMDDWPRTATIETPEGEEIALCTYFWAYGGSFQEGDDITLTGDTAEGEDVIYLWEPGHYAALEEVFDSVPD